MSETTIPTSLIPFLLVLISIVFIVLICVVTMTAKHYLNYNSTSAPDFNYSDLLYPEVQMEREGVEELKSKVLSIVNAPVGSKCIITSGATEAIANCIKWAKKYIPNGTITGSSFDHSAVEANSKTNGMSYKKINLENDPIPDNTAAIFVTQVNGSNGEFQSLKEISKNLNSESFLIDGGMIKDESRVLQYHPLIFLDATQSIMKLPIDMEKNRINAVFFSLHKLGGEQGLGFLIINEGKFPKFEPLIAGEQQDGLRGGTLPIQHILEFREVFNNFDDFLKRKNRWEEVYEKFKDHGIEVLKPNGKHLYSTFLIKTKKCSKAIISELAEKGIYIGAKSACSLENGKNENVIRISFKDPEELDEKVVDTIIQELE